MPAEQSVSGKCRIPMAGGVQDHIDDTFNVAIHQGQCIDVYAQRRAMDDLTDWALRDSPSISQVLTTSSVRAARLA